jgi:prolyl oligopeptidase
MPRRGAIPVPPERVGRTRDPPGATCDFVREITDLLPSPAAMPRVLLVAAAIGWLQIADAGNPRYPAAPRGPIVDEYHGVRVADPYRWLEQTGSAQTARWIRAEDQLTAAFLARTARPAIRRRLTQLWDRVTVGVPWREGGRLFFVMRGSPDQQGALYAQDDENGPPKVVVDSNRLSRSGSIAVSDFSVSPDGRLVAYALAQGGADAAETRVRNVSTGRESTDAVRGVLGSVCWTRDAHGFFYIASTTNTASSAAAASSIQKEFAYHVLGEPQSRDRRIREWSDNYRWGYCMLSDDGRRAIAVVERGSESEVYTMDLAAADRPDVRAPLVRLLGDGSAHTPIGTLGDTLYAITNREAPRRRLVALNLADSTPSPRPIVAESADVIEDAALISNRIVVNYLSDVKSRLQLFTLDGQPAGDIPLPGMGSVPFGLSARSSRPDVYYSFTGFLTPTTVFHYDGQTGVTTPFHPPAALSDVAAFETRQVRYRSKDGTLVPMFITSKKGAALDGGNPTLLTAYGGYGATLKPEFQPDVLLWLQLGGVYALASIRGGGEYGEEWHRAGMLDRKQTSFDDFVGAAEYLIRERITSREKLAIYGHSNGGLLVGAVMTQRPDLFAVAAANAGHYDMLRYPRFTVGAGWIPEYGSPDDPAAFPVLRAYSPLHNVRPGTCYPAALLLAADHDDRVVPSHAYKFAAALQAAQACGRPILLRVAHQASHSYASKSTRLAELADMWAFIAKQLKLGLTE